MSGQEFDAFSVTSREELAQYLLDRARSVESGEHPMENGTSVDYVRAAGYWVHDMSGFFANQGEETPKNPDWKTIAMIFAAAFVYE
ncbi:hypothetical protein GCM10010218_15710 [Streptomyces mashuensis]|uniref:DUF7660 domain-containing protein n=1 Tax=Streptomyces mashuensis TaxID=33904 RepID=A0A919ECE1_9ACTN|nr:hypothetical protein [Streptomyces mashuensis]GHF35340.1 hypothetical protein GCM10010218_15710 [Streptomyces mashuensis]